MTTKIEKIIEPNLKKDLPDIQPGDTVKVHQKIKERSKKAKQGKQERIQVFEGVILAIKHGRGISGTITVRKMVGDVGVERIFPIHSPNIEKIEVLQRGQRRRAKLYYLRDRVGKKAKLKRKGEKIEKK
jgi:large subunit ribosomal protein L19